VTSLRELQRDVGRALLGHGDEAAAAAVVEDGLTAQARLGIYRHHVFTTLTAALQATFPVVGRLVDERFFAYAADQYIRVDPPASPCLFEYGATFPAFLGGFPACEGLRYLADVARLEWALSRALHAPDHVALEAAALRAQLSEVDGQEVFSLDPSLSLVASPWPIDRIWRVNQPEADPDATVDLSAGEVRLEVRRLGDDVVFRGLDPGVFAFRHALTDGYRLAEAVERARSADEAFDLPAALAAIHRDGLLAGIARPARSAGTERSGGRSADPANRCQPSPHPTRRADIPVWGE